MNLLVSDIDMSKLDERLMQLLARQRLHQLLSEPQLLPAMDPKTSVHATPMSTTQPEQKTGKSAGILLKTFLPTK